MDNVRVRFAPSPTGKLHLGGLRTAIYNYLLAKHFAGKFIVRFEDTDLKRNIVEEEANILFSLIWTKIKIDESIDKINSHYGPYRQSERIKIYEKHVLKLIFMKKAYFCFCTVNEINEARLKQKQAGVKAPQYSKKCKNLTAEQVINFKKEKPFCIRLKVEPNQKISWIDLVYSTVIFDSKNIEDFVLLKSNKFPAYNFAVVVDDYLMNISHVLRGSDHLSNTPKQILIYQAFNWKIPKFGHLTLIKSNQAQKMSKREFVPENFLQYYIDKGFLPEAIFNYLALLGWCPELEQEIFTIPEMIDRFDGTKLNRAESQFSFSKLIWINRNHLAKLDHDKYLKEANPFLLKFSEKYQVTLKKIQELVITVRGTIDFFDQIEHELTVYFQSPTIEYEKTDYELLSSQEKILIDFIQQIKTIKNWEKEVISQELYQIQNRSSLVKKKTFNLLRIFLTSRKKGPRLYNLIYFLGCEKILKINQNFQKIKIKN